MVKKLITFNGKTLTIAGWSRELGISQVTLGARLGRYAMPLEVALQGKSLSVKPSGKHYKKLPEDWEHRVVAAKALGKPLPPGAVVHHVDENKMNNNPSNLVVCTHAYHRLIHARMDAHKATGHYDWRKCVYCKEWDAPQNLKKTASNAHHHRLCHNEYHRVLRQEKKAK